MTDRPGQPETTTRQPWERCPIGSCGRHQECMYRPCRSADQTTAYTVDDAIREVRERMAGRTRYVGQPPFREEVLVAEIERLRKVAEDLAIRAAIAEAKTPPGRAALEVATQPAT